MLKEFVKKLFLTGSILLLLVVLMVGFNLTLKSIHKETEPFSIVGVTAYNSEKVNPDRCTWHCSFNTNYCKANHVNILKDHFPWTDRLYFGIISGLMSLNFGFSAAFNYGIANLLILVLFIPLVIIYFFTKGFRLQKEINQLKQKWNK